MILDENSAITVPRVQPILYYRLIVSLSLIIGSISCKVLTVISIEAPTIEAKLKLKRKEVSF